MSEEFKKEAEEYFMGFVMEEMGGELIPNTLELRIPVQTVINLITNAYEFAAKKQHNQALTLFLAECEKEACILDEWKPSYVRLDKIKQIAHELRKRWK